MLCLEKRFVKFSACFPLHNLDSKAALSITILWPPQLMLFWLLSSSRKDKMAAGFEIEVLHDRSRILHGGQGGLLHVGAEKLFLSSQQVSGHSQVLLYQKSLV